MNRFAANHPDDWEERLDGLLEAGDLRRVERREAPLACDSCDEPEGEIRRRADGSTLCAACDRDNPIDRHDEVDERRFKS